MARDGGDELVGAGVEGGRHGVFTSGMSTAFLVAGVVAVAGALVTLLTRRPAEEETAPPGTPSTEHAAAAEVPS